VIVVYSEEALATLFELSDFIDSINTVGAGERWVAKLTIWVEGYALANVTFALCNDDYLASLKLSCINYNDWIIAFSIKDDLFVVHKIIRGNLLT
jgi:hypothetical protein